MALSTQQLRKLCGLRTTTLCQTLQDLRRAGRVAHGAAGYTLADARATSASPAIIELHTSVSFPAPPIGSTGNGNGKRACPARQERQLTLFSGET